jgi:hypothetical protein
VMRSKDGGCTWDEVLTLSKLAADTPSRGLIRSIEIPKVAGGDKRIYAVLGTFTGTGGDVSGASAWVHAHVSNVHKPPNRNRSFGSRPAIPRSCISPSSRIRRA